MFIPTTSLCSLSVNFTGLVLSAEQIVYRTADRRGRTQGGRPSVLRVRFMWHACCATGWPWPRVFCLSTSLSLYNKHQLAIYTQEGYAVRTNGAVIAMLSFSVSDRRYRVAFGAINVS